VRDIYVAADGTRYTFTLESDGDVVYCAGTACPGAGVIPIPAAAWLFGSGLLGLAGVARRRTAAAAA
jgi:hypothetical protein